MRLVRMALSSLTGAFLSLSMAHAQANKACWLTTYANSSYSVDALSEIIEAMDDVPLCVMNSPTRSGIEVGHVAYEGVEGSEVLACLYKDSNGNNSYGYEFQWLSANYTQLQQEEANNPYLKDPAGITTELFLSKRVFEFCDLLTGEPEIGAQGGKYQGESISGGGDKPTGEAEPATQGPRFCMGSRTEEVGGENRRYFSFGTKSADGERCELGESRYYEKSPYYETLGSANTHSDSTQQSPDQVFLALAPENQGCRFPEYVKGNIDVCKFDIGTDNGHYWIRDGQEMRHSAGSLGECARFNYEPRFCMDMKGHCIIGRKVKHDSDHNRNYCYVCNKEITQEAKKLDWSKIKCITP
ncbi:hypothetical protein [Endozoicomonas sp. 8E]|uniref:hypothetical protein n=1 Tax=Endozoicomonas sp. 8E TaxID=3035692 RepID=UPI0029392D3B|nr:hypothetical protein [Endozoicomonas sp. 8E]WOG28805.1 hypothetical protein P6910_03865 [Endozoicomonas sp. 8E]